MKAITPVAEIEVSYRPVKSWREQPQISSSNDAYDILRSYFPDSTVYLQESFVILYLDRGNRVKGVYRHTKGSMTGTLADVRMIIGIALKLASTGIIIAHNHPSGKKEPSEADKNLTKKLATAAEIFDISLHDHLIICPDEIGYYSFADEESA